MIILDTDALSHTQRGNAVGMRIGTSLSRSVDPEKRITSISAYEMVGGAIQLIERQRQARRELIPGFRLLQDLIEYLGGWNGRILSYDVAAESIYRAFTPRLRQELKYDARIAAIALANGAVVWTLNVADFKRVEGLAGFHAETGIRV